MFQVSLLLIPTDVSLFREPRPFEAGTTGVRSLTFPTPAATSGAVRTWLLNGLGAETTLRGLRRKTAELAKTAEYADSDRSVLIKAALQQLLTGHPAAWVVESVLRGPLLCARDGALHFPVPQHLVTHKHEAQNKNALLHRLAPLSSLTSLPGALIPDGAPPAFRPCWLPTSSSLESTIGYLSENDMEEALDLAGEVMNNYVQNQEAFCDYDHRLGIGMDSDRNSTLDGMLYSASFLRLRDTFNGCATYGFRVDILSKTDITAVVDQVCRARPWLTLGGERKTAHVEILANSSALPQFKAAWPLSPQGRFYTYLATPGLFALPEWYPRHLTKYCDLIGAIVRDPLLYAGWDMSGGRPLPTRRAVQAGGVHFWQIKEDIDPASFDDPQGINISDTEEDCQAGWGLCLRGEWNYA